MSFVTGIFKFVSSDKSDYGFNTLQPWWDVIVGFAIDISVLVAITSVTSDVFQGSGALRCIPVNKTHVIPLSSLEFIQQECTELWPLYAKYFPYFLALQCGLLLLVRMSWRNICKHQLMTFSQLVIDCKAAHLTRKKVQDFLHLRRHCVGSDKAKSFGNTAGGNLTTAIVSVEDAAEESVESFLSLNSLQLDEEQAQKALTLHDRIHDLDDRLDDLVSVTFVVKVKSFIAVTISAFVVGWGSRQVLKKDFDFYFPCHLHPGHHVNILDYYEYVCVNKTTTTSLIMQVFFIVTVAIQGLAELFGLIECLSVKLRPSPSSSSSSSPVRKASSKGDHSLLGENIEMLDEPVVEMGGRHGRIRNGVNNNNNNNDNDDPRRHRRGNAILSDVTRGRGAVDDLFLQRLLTNADQDGADKLKDFSNAGFREELEELVTCLQWPYWRLRKELKPVDDDGEREDDDKNNGVCLSLADVNLLTLPDSLLRRGEKSDPGPRYSFGPSTGRRYDKWHLVSLDLSFNEDLVHLDETILQSFGDTLETLKCRKCGLVDVDPIFRGLKRLTFLDISFNELRRIAAVSEVVRLKRLRSLLIDGNPFDEEVFDERIFRELMQLHEILIEPRFVGGVAAAAGFKAVKGYPKKYTRNVPNVESGSP